MEPIKRIKIGIVGVRFGNALINSMQHGDAIKFFEVAAICDKNVELANLISERYGVKAYYDMDALLEDDEIEAIGLFTGPVGRAQLIRRIMKAGKDVMTTKPFELDPAEALSVLQEAKSMSRVVHLNSPSPMLTGEQLLIKRWVQEYNLGQPVACRYNVWCSKREKETGTWYDDPDQCPEAPIFRIGVYLINELISIFGNAAKVQSLSSRLFTGRPTADNAQLGILYNNGAIANIFASFCINDGQNQIRSMVLNFENGTIYKKGGVMLPEKLKEEVELSLVTHDEKGESILVKAVPEGSDEDYQWEAFYRAIHGEAVGQVGMQEIVEGVKVLNAMARAAKSQCTETV